MRMTDLKWQQRFLSVAAVVSKWSKDPSTKVGCVLVSEDGVILASGYNGLPRGVEDRPERMEWPVKYLWTVHAEARCRGECCAVWRAAEGGDGLYQPHELRGLRQVDAERRD